jgi:thymidylate synthase
MRGDTDATILSSKGVKIWNGNSTREYLDSIGLNHYNVGELGAVYGYQWRFWNKPYVPFNQRIEESCNEFCINGHTHDHANETLNEGIDQLAQCIDMIRNNPTSRRILFHSWNPEQLHEMALPPCHILYSFTVNTVTNELNCTMFQRSADCFLGLPFNIASTAILLMTMCKLTDTVPGDITIAINDAHIYLNHIEPVNTQLERTPYRFPSMTIKEFTNNNDITVIDTLTSADYTLNNYVCHPTIKADMAV